MSTKIGSQQKQSPEDYRRREDQYLCIEIQPYRDICVASTAHKRSLKRKRMARCARTLSPAVKRGGP